MSRKVTRESHVAIAISVTQNTVLCTVTVASMWLARRKEARSSRSMLPLHDFLTSHYVALTTLRVCVRDPAHAVQRELMVERLLQYYYYYSHSSILYGETLLTILTSAVLGCPPPVGLQCRRKASSNECGAVENSSGVCSSVYQSSQRGASMRLREPVH